MRHKMAVVGIGHPERGDDALGPITIEKISIHLPKEIATYSILGDVTSILEIFEKYHTVILIDAILTKKGNSGEIFRFTKDTAFDFISPTSTHAFDLAQTLALADNLNLLPSKLVILGMQGEQFQPGAPLSLGIQKNLSLFIQKILEEINTLK